MLSTITAIRDTVLKVSTAPSTSLDPSQKIEIYEGQVLTVLRKGPLDSGHMEVTLSDNGGDWYIYVPHWKNLRKMTSCCSSLYSESWTH